jgi:micrococcal nuclease
MYLTRCEYVYDGDTIRTKEGHIRLASIDTPELKQPLGLEARSFLQQLIEGKTISIVPLETDKYGRTVAQVIYNGRDISEMIALQGLAYPYFTHTINASRVEKAADYAKKLKLGVWASYNERPQDFRKRSKPAVTSWNIGAWGR